MRGKGYSGEDGGGEEVLVDVSEPRAGTGGEDGSRQAKPHEITDMSKKQEASGGSIENAQTVETLTWDISQGLSGTRTDIHFITEN